MSESKIEVKIGEFSFSGQGSEAWLSDKLEQIMDKAEELVQLNSSLQSTKQSASNQNNPATGSLDMSGAAEIAQKALAKFLSDKNATKVQNDKFLATAVWLHAKGKKYLTTADVAGALKDAQQTKINKPSQCLSQNISKGFCEKEGSQFFVTQDGKDAIGV